MKPDLMSYLNEEQEARPEFLKPSQIGNYSLEERLIRGVNLLADTVKVTLGAKGRTVIFNDANDKTVITKDGATVAKHVHSADPYQEMAIKVIREASTNTMVSSGDGTTTTLVLAQEIINSFSKFQKDNKDSKISYYDFNKACERFFPMVVSEIEKYAFDAEEHVDKLQDLASVSANDPAIGELIQSIINEIGVYGDIEVVSNTSISSTVVETVKGIKTNRGFFSSAFCNNKAENTFEKDDVDILIIYNILRDPTFIQPFVEYALSRRRGLLVFVDDIAPIALKNLENLVSSSNIPLMFVEHDGMGDNKLEIMNDIAYYTNAAVVSCDVDIKTELLNNGSFVKNCIGSCKKVKVNDYSCSLIGGEYIEADLNQQLEYVKGILAKPGISSYQRKFNKKRLGYLTGGMAVINVGGQTEIEMKELKDRIDDAVLAVKSAVRDGICYGGAYTWVKVFDALSTQLNEMYEESNESYLSDSANSRRIILEVLLPSLLSPLKQLLINADMYDKYGNIYSEISENDKGIELKVSKLQPVSEYKIFDAASVLIDAFTNAITVSKSLLSINRAIFDGFVHHY